MNILENKYFWYVCGLLAISIIFYLILQKVGLIKTSEDKANATIIDTITYKPNEFTRPTFYKKLTNKGILLDNETLKNLSALINESFFGKGVNKWLFPMVSSMGTLYSQFFTALNNIGSQAQFSQLAEQYYLDWERDLQTDITEYLDEPHLIKYSNYINALPTIL